jgi:hypothetical protein
MALYCEENMPPTVPFYDSDSMLVGLYTSKYYAGICPSLDSYIHPVFKPLQFVSWLGKNALVGAIDGVPKLAYLASCIIQPDDIREVKETLLATYSPLAACEMTNLSGNSFFIYAWVVKRDMISLDKLLGNKAPPHDVFMCVCPINCSKTITIEQLWSRS